MSMKTVPADGMNAASDSNSPAGTSAVSTTVSATGALISMVRQQEDRAVLVGFLTAGFPTVDRSIEALKTLIDQGVDVLELGIPYSDPVMDGSVIQAAGQCALDAGFRVRDVFRVVRALNEYAPHVPVLVMTYWNPVLQYGPERFARDLAAAGGAGLVTPDLIPDEGEEWLAASEAYGLDRVFLVASSSSPERLRLTAQAARGFVYAAAVRGVTGMRSQVGSHAEQLVEDARTAGAEHVCVGLGVSTSVQAAEVAKYADGVIVGSVLVHPLLSDKPLTEDEWAVRLSNLAEVAKSLVAGVRSVREAPTSEASLGVPETGGNP